MSARRLACRVLVRVAREGAYADRALNVALERSRLTTRDRALATELVYGTLRHARYLDFLLGQLTDRPLRKVAPPVLATLRMGAHQILNTRVPARAAVDESVKLVRSDHRHAAGFVNAVLRKLATCNESGQLPDPDLVLDDPVAALAVRSCHPDWILDEIRQTRGDAAMRAWVEANNQRPPLALRINRRRSDRETVATMLANAGCEVDVRPEFPEALEVRDAGKVVDMPGFADGLFTVQDLGAQLIARLARPERESFVLDGCAAPGGKATHLAELMDDSGTVLAVDIHPAKTRLIAQAAERLGLSCIEPAAADATDPVAIGDLLYDRDREHADMVVVDAPCSGLGTLRRNHELRDREPDAVRELCQLQDHLLDAAAELVKPAGTIIYAVCTVTAAEGPERVAALLERNRDLELETITDDELGQFVETYNKLGTVIRTWTDIHRVDGFFAARMRRKD